MGGSHELGPNEVDQLAALREPPVLYVLDADLRVAFSSAGAEREVSRELDAALRAAVHDVEAGSDAVRVYRDRIVRATPLSTTDGGVAYAVLLERFSAGDLVRQAAARFGLTPPEALALAEMIAGGHPADAAASESLGQKIPSAHGEHFIERLLNEAVE